MKIVKVSKIFFNPIPLPGMGRSLDISNISEAEAIEIRESFSKKELFVEFEEEPGNTLRVIQLWSNPHSLQFTLFV